MAFKFRRGLESDRITLSGVNVPPEGEPLWVTNESRFYIGDGITTGGVEIGGEKYYTNLTPMPEVIHGISANTIWDGSDTIQDVLTAILYPYQDPEFSSFSIDGQETILEVGDSAATGSITFIWGTTNSSNVESNTVDIVDTTNGITHETNIANDGTQGPTAYYDTSGVTKTSEAFHTWTIDADDTEAKNFSRTFTVKWLWTYYWGSDGATTMTETLIKGLQNSSLLSFPMAGNNYVCDATNYKWLCFPSSETQPTTFTDAGTNNPIAMETAQTVSVTNTFGVTIDYEAYRTTNPIVGEVTITVG